MRIFVVDDEALITRYIVQCIQNAPGKHEVVGTASSGAKALEKIGEARPDVLFTDITMPKMDGLELLRICKEQHPEISVMMLTCHDDFEYARQAMQDHADDYMLKSEISPEFIGRKLEKLENNRKKRNTDHVADRIKQENYMRAVTSARERSVYLLNEHDLRDSSILLREDAFLAISFSNRGQNADLILQSIPDIFENFLLYPYNERINILFCNIKENTGLIGLEEKERYINTCINDLRMRLKGYVGRSRIFYRLARLPMAIDESVADIERQYYGTGMNGDVAMQEANRIMQRMVISAAARAEEKDFSGCAAAIEEILVFAERNHPDSSRLLQCVIQALDLLAQSTEQSLDWTEGTLQQAEGFKAMRALVHKQIGRLMQQRRCCYSAAIGKAVDYIDRHFGEELTLNVVADHVFLNREYLSRQFKKEVGTNFSEYLMELRLREALRLLRGTELRIGEVADRVGMPNVSYFTSVFKKQYHMTPSEARKR